MFDYEKYVEKRREYIRGGMTNYNASELAYQETKKPDNETYRLR